MIIDPMLHKDAREKVLRYDGEIPGDKHSITPVPSDPRPKKPGTILQLRNFERMVDKPEPMDLPLPNFEIDANYVGEPPRREVTLDNLNDNIDKQFLGKTVVKFGEIDAIFICYHPVTNKHLGELISLVPINLLVEG